MQINLPFESVVPSKFHSNSCEQTHYNEMLLEGRVGIEMGWNAIACEVVVNRQLVELVREEKQLGQLVKEPSELFRDRRVLVQLINLVLPVPELESIMLHPSVVQSVPFAPFNPSKQQLFLFSSDEFFDKL